MMNVFILLCKISTICRPVPVWGMCCQSTMICITKNKWLSYCFKSFTNINISALRAGHHSLLRLKHWNGYSQTKVFYKHITNTQKRTWWGYRQNATYDASRVREYKHTSAELCLYCGPRHTFPWNIDVDIEPES